MLFLSDEFTDEEGGTVRTPDTLGGTCARITLAVDDAADETQIGRQQIGIVGNEYPADIELYLALARGLEQTLRRQPSPAPNELS